MHDPALAKRRENSTHFQSRAGNKQIIRQLAQQIDHHRKRQQEQHPDLTLTGLYNVLEKLRRIDHPRRAVENSRAAMAGNGKATDITEEADARSSAAMADSRDSVATGEGKSPPIERQSPPALGRETPHGGIMPTGETLSPKEKTIHQQGLVSVLQQLHDDLDRAVFDAYGWNDMAEKLVGRPGATATQEEAPLDASTTPAEITTAKTPWPKSIPEQVQALRAALHQHPEPATAGQLARTFKGAQSKRVSEILDTLVAMGQAREEGGRYAGA